MQDQQSWSARPVGAGKEIRACRVVRGKFSGDRAAPANRRTVAAGPHKIDIVGRGIIFVRRHRFTGRDVCLHLVAAVGMQPMAHLQNVHRCAHERIDSTSGESSQRQGRRAAPTADGPSRTGISARCPYHSFLWRVRKIIEVELKSFAQLEIKFLERGAEFALDPLTRVRFRQLRTTWDRLTEREPNGRSAKWQPAPSVVKAIAPKNHARQY